MRKIIFYLCAVSVLAWGALLGQNSPQSTRNPSQQTPNAAQGEAQQQSQSEQQPAQTQEQPKKEHMKKISGKLVDAPCMEKGLSSAPGVPGQAAPQSSSPQASAGYPSAGQTGQEHQTGHERETGQEHFLGAAQTGQTPGGPGQAGQQMPPNQQTPSTQPGMNPYPDQNAPARTMSPAEKQAQQCPANASTSTFGLVLSNGKFVKLDDEGNTKASAALKETKVKEGKAPKAEVKGTLEGYTVKVAEIRVKGQRGGSSAGGQGRAGQPSSPGQ
jgi:hypothetical protein